MSEHSHSINTLEKLAQFLSEEHIIERQGVVVHRHPQRMIICYTALSCFASLLAFKWPILTVFLLLSIWWSVYQEYRNRSAWVSNLSLRSCGENLILWNKCRFFDESPNIPPEYIIAIPWNLHPNPKQSWFFTIAAFSPALILLPLLWAIPPIKIGVPLILFALTLLAYKQPKKSLPELHPYVLQTVQQVENTLEGHSYAILLFDGGSDSNGLKTFLLNYAPMLDPVAAPLIIIESSSSTPTISSHPQSLIISDQVKKLAVNSWGGMARSIGWSVAHFQGAFTPELLIPSLEHWKTQQNNNSVLEDADTESSPL